MAQPVSLRDLLPGALRALATPAPTRPVRAPGAPPVGRGEGCTLSHLLARVDERAARQSVQG